MTIAPSKELSTAVCDVELRGNHVRRCESKERWEVTTDRRPLVTLTSVEQAQVGRIFIHKGPGSKCPSCEYLQACVENVELGRVYRIVKVREKTLPCKFYEMKMQVVEVVDAEIPAAIPANQAIPSVMITFHMPDCEEEGCGNRELCFATGLREGDRCEVLDITETLQCSLGSPRKRVLLLRVPAS